MAAVAKTLGVVSQTLFNWVKAERQGKLRGVDTKVVSAEQMEISRLRADLSGHSQEQLDAIADEINDRPRKVLGVRSPLAVYRELLLNSSQPSPLIH